MLFFSDPPMMLGQTLRGTDDGTTTGNLINSERLGQIFMLPRQTLTGGPTGQKSRSTGMPVFAVLLRNTSGAALLPSLLAQVSRTAGYKMLQECDGYSTTLANQRIVLVDDQLPSAGVADKDIFWGIIGGPALVTTSMNGTDQNGDIAVNAPLVAATGSTTGATTSGRVSNITLPGQTGATNSVTMMLGYLGTALSARTTGETNALLLANMALHRLF